MNINTASSSSSTMSTYQDYLCLLHFNYKISLPSIWLDVGFSVFPLLYIFSPYFSYFFFSSPFIYLHTRNNGNHIYEKQHKRIFSCKFFICFVFLSCNQNSFALFSKWKRNQPQNVFLYILKNMCLNIKRTIFDFTFRIWFHSSNFQLIIKYKSPANEIVNPWRVLHFVCI